MIRQVFIIFLMGILLAGLLLVALVQSSARDGRDEQEE